MFAFAATSSVSISSFLGSPSSVAPICAAPAKWTAAMSKSVPFMPKPEAIPEGTIGSVEFDPLGLSIPLPFAWMQEAEIKHGRIAMRRSQFALADFILVAGTGWLYIRAAHF
jgi:hypothetical protein